MCGICGFSGEKNPELLSRMMELIEHRGPDDYGKFENAHISLGHRRLSIIGVDDGKQPIYNEDGNIILVYNGEIYNYRELKRSLINKGHKFRTETDSEVIVHLYEEEGIDLVKKLNGMFAFSIWDKNKKKLFLVRDQVGIKPLYYTIKDNNILFASEIKALAQSGIREPDLDESSLEKFLFYRYIPDEMTFFKGIKKLLAGDILEFSNGNISITNYRNIESMNTGELSDKALVQKLREISEKSVRRRLMSEVPLGIFLSGGIDSSTIAALTYINSLNKISTFSVGFSNQSSDSELPYALQVAKSFNSRHFEKTIGIEEVLENLPKIAWHYDEPIGDGAVIPTFLISKLAREKVTVILAGEGSDEQFAGYDKYRKMQDLYLSGIRDKNILAEHYFTEISVFTPEEINALKKNFNLNKFKDNLFSKISKIFDNSNENNLINNLLSFDQTSMLSENYLMKADKMSMAWSLEERVPFLDKEVLSFTSSLSSSSKYKWLAENKEKYLLRESMKHILPMSIIERKKKGYGTPLKYWFQKSLGDLLISRLKKSEAINRFFDIDYIIQLVNDNNNLNQNIQSRKLWAIFAFDLWYEIYILKKSIRPNSSYEEFLN